MSVEVETPVYDWEFARVGDSAEPVRIQVDPARIPMYVAAQGDDNPLYQDPEAGDALGMPGLAVPLLMVRLYAPVQRREVVEARGARYVDFPTPVVHWRCVLHTAPRPGDTITSITRIHDKYEKNGRHFLTWLTTGTNQDGKKVVDFFYTNLWDRGRPEDRNR